MQAFLEGVKWKKTGIEFNNPTLPVISCPWLLRKKISHFSYLLDDLHEPHVMWESQYGMSYLWSCCALLCQVTVVSVASPTSNTSQKSMALPVNVALGQQILTVQQPASVSPVKVATSQTTAQVRGKDRAGLFAIVGLDLLQAGKCWNVWKSFLLRYSPASCISMKPYRKGTVGLDLDITYSHWFQCRVSISLCCLGVNLSAVLSEHFQNIKPVQSVYVGGVGGSQFKNIIPLASQPNVQQIQVPGSRFHYVRLVTATTASSTVQPSGPSTSSIQTGDL